MVSVILQGSMNLHGGLTIWTMSWIQFTTENVIYSLLGLKLLRNINSISVKTYRLEQQPIRYLLWHPIMISDDNNSTVVLSTITNRAHLNGCKYVCSYTRRVCMLSNSQVCWSQARETSKESFYGHYSHAAERVVGRGATRGSWEGCAVCVRIGVRTSSRSARAHNKSWLNHAIISHCALGGYIALLKVAHLHSQS